MSTTDPLDRRLLLGVDGPSGLGPGGDDPDDLGSAPAPPPVAVVLVTDDGGPRFDDTVAAVAAQDHVGLGLLVLQTGDGPDLSDRVARLAPGAIVRRVRADGFAEAANTCANALDPVPAYWCFVRDGTVLDPGVVRILVDEAYRSNAAIVGPKVVDARNPEVLVDVGRAIDRFGGAHTGIEPGELDQEQHDAVRDVFYVTDVTMLVRADLFSVLRGFDPEADPGSEDLDLCWRARLAGGRVMVVPDARVLSPYDPATKLERSRAEIRDRARKRVRTVLTCSSTGTLVRVLPLGLIGSVLEALAFSFSRRRAEGFADARAWWWNLRHFRRLRGSRRRAQRHRTVADRDLRELQLGWTERLQSFLSHHHADERLESIGDRMRAIVDRVFEALRHPGTLAFTGFVVVLAFGSRHLLTRGVPAVGELVPWTGVRTMFEAYGSAWRHTGMGAARAASGALGAMGTLTAVLFNHPGLARTVVVVGVFVIGALGASRLVRRLGASRGPAMATAVLYGIAPVARNGVAEGRLGALVLFAGAPYIVLGLVRVAGFRDVEQRSGRWRALLGLCVATAVTTAFWPPAAGFVGLVVVALLVGSLCTGRDVVASLRAVVAGLAGLVGGAVLLAPWVLTFRDFADDRGAFGFDQYLVHLRLDDVLRMQTGPAGVGLAAWGIWATALFALLVASGPRFAWVVRAWFLAAAGIAVVYVPSQLWPGTAVPAPEGALAATALGLAVAAGLGLGTFADELRRARFGWRQPAAVIAGLGIVLAAVGFTADAFGGRWHAPLRGWNDTVSFTGDRLFAGEFRVLWVGDPSVLPTEPFEVRTGLGYAVTRNGAGDAREIVRAAAGPADAVLARAVRLAVEGRTDRLGRLVGPMGVRYIAVPTRNGPGGPEAAPVPGLRRRIAAQLDLAELQGARGLALYENTAWVPVTAYVDEGVEIPAGAEDPLAAVVGLDLAVDAEHLGSDPVDPGTVVFAETYDGHWTASAGGRALAHGRAYGWGNAYDVRAPGRVVVAYDAQRPATFLAVGQGVLWLIVLVVAWRGRRRWTASVVPGDERGRQVAREDARARRDARDAAVERRRRDELDDDFWSGS